MKDIHISISKDNSERSVNFVKKEVKFDELPTITISKHYSNIISKDGIRKGVNFEGVDFLALDVDDGLSIDEMKDKLKGHKALIVTTKSHRANEKNGKAITPCDRYRLFFPLEQPITDADRYKTVIAGLIKEFQADEMCKDLARFYYCNPKQEVHTLDGEAYWDISQYETVAKSKKVKASIESKKITKSTRVIDEDGNEMTIADFYMAIEDGESVMTHCRLSPESHSNNDATASCSMKKNGDFLNLKCFGCGESHAFYFGESEKKTNSKYTYSVVEVNKEELSMELKKGLSSISDIVAEMVRLLPALKKEEKKND